MKRLALILCLAVLFGLLSACMGEETALPAESSEAVIESLPKESPASDASVDKPEPGSDPASEPEASAIEPVSEAQSHAESEPVPVPPPPYRFRVVDQSGNPVAHVTGSLYLDTQKEWRENGELRVQERGDGDAPTPLTATDGGSFSGADGMLYFTEWDALKWIQSNGGLSDGELHLSAQYDFMLRQTVIVDLSAPPKELTVVWDQRSPPATEPERLYFHIVDERGNPVEALYGDLNKVTDLDGKNVAAENVDSAKLAYWPISLNSADGSGFTKADGMLYTTLPWWIDDLEDRVYTLTLAGIWDGSLVQEYKIVLGDPPRRYELTWKLPHPPKSSGEGG